MDDFVVDGDNAEAVNRTKVELKSIPRSLREDREATVNRTKVELKSALTEAARVV